MTPAIDSKGAGLHPGAFAFCAPVSNPDPGFPWLLGALVVLRALFFTALIEFLVGLADLAGVFRLVVEIVALGHDAHLLWLSTLGNEAGPGCPAPGRST